MKTRMKESILYASRFSLVLLPCLAHHRIQKKMREVNEKRKVFYVYIHTVVSVMERKKRKWKMEMKNLKKVFVLCGRFFSFREIFIIDGNLS